jgi:hypothetical protein
MSAICQNCKSKLSCGCQKRSASNGVPVCTMCLSSYEATLKTSPVAPVIKGITHPTNVTVLYKAPAN